MRARKWVFFISPHVLSLVRDEAHNAECRLCQLEDHAACQQVIYGALEWVVSVVSRIWQLEWGEEEESILYIGEHSFGLIRFVVQAVWEIGKRLWSPRREWCPRKAECIETPGIEAE